MPHGGPLRQTRRGVQGVSQAEGEAMKIVISHVNPPIPERNHDYCAYIDGEEERRRQGWGRTPAEALRDFLDNYEDDL